MPKNLFKEVYPEIYSLVAGNKDKDIFYRNAFSLTYKEFVSNYRLTELARVADDHFDDKKTVDEAISTYTATYFSQTNTLHKIINEGLLAYSKENKNQLISGFVASFADIDTANEAMKFFDYYGYLVNAVKKHEVACMYLKDVNRIIFSDDRLQLTLRQSFVDDLYEQYFLGDYDDIPEEEKIKIAKNIRDKVVKYYDYMVDDKNKLLKRNSSLLVQLSDNFTYENRLETLMLLK